MSDVCFLFKNAARGWNCGTQGPLLKGTFALGSLQHLRKFRLAPRPLPGVGPLSGGFLLCLLSSGADPLPLLSWHLGQARSFVVGVVSLLPPPAPRPPRGRSVERSSL